MKSSKERAIRKKYVLPFLQQSFIVNNLQLQELQIAH